MSAKEELIKKFQKDYQRYWKVDLFDRLGFDRQYCKSCGKFFWALEEKPNCGDSACINYGFIGDSPTKKKFDFKQSWKEIENFFTKNNHKSIKRYPTIARWRPDLYFNIASITSFQRVENNKIIFDFPADKLIIPQTCLRFNDIPNVGVTGRHFTSFTMIGQHTVANKNGYWKDQCIELDWKLLTEVFGINPNEITFTEDTWMGHGAFGYSLEYFVRGLELGNAVFTEFEGTPQDYKQMDQKIIDMGAGLERFAWLSNGTPTAYDVAFGDVIQKMVNESNINYDKEFFEKYAKLSSTLNADEANVSLERKKIAEKLGVSTETLKENVVPMQALYAIADHSRSLLYAISDGMIPSNTGGGYNLRTIARRMFYFMDMIKPNFNIEDVTKWHADYLKSHDPKLSNHLEDVNKVLNHEREKHVETSNKVRRIVKSVIETKKEISEEKMIELYDSQGVSPELLKEEASKQGITVDIPSNFYSKVTDKHTSEKIEYQKPKFDTDNVDKTELLFYESPFEKEFNAKIIKVFDNGNVVLDKTHFYPRGGGQEPDKGTINNSNVKDVIKIGDVVVHITDGEFSEGDTVNCKLDWQRRWQIMQHHTGIHILGAAAKKVLGKHIWQAGSFKDEDYARIDLTHFESLSNSQINEIENEVNKLVEESLDVNIKWVPRHEAEEKYGFTIYQGGSIPGNKLRIIDISGKDIQACGGTHVKNTKDIGKISIVSSERIQDGIIRLTIVAGKKGEQYIKKMQNIVNQSSNLLNTDSENLPKAAETLFENWKQSNKELEKTIDEFSQVKAEELSKENEFVISQINNADNKILMKIIDKLKDEKDTIVLFGLKDKINVAMVSKSIDSGKTISKLCKTLGGGGGGSPKQGAGVIQDVSKINQAVEMMNEVMENERK